MLPKLFNSIEATILARFREAGFVKHSGDKGENREYILQEFLKKHLPARYGVTKGEIITKSGERSHSADIIIYDAINCPVLYSEKTSIVPIEGVYGIIEVKSALSKAEFLDAAGKIRLFKELAPRDLATLITQESATVRRASRPFGMVLGYDFADNSLTSLLANWREFHNDIKYVNYFVNCACVLGGGLLRFEKVNLDLGEKSLLLDTDQFVQDIELQQQAERLGKKTDDIRFRTIVEELKEATFGRFFVYLLLLLSRMKLNQPDLGQYIDPELVTVFRES